MDIAQNQPSLARIDENSVKHPTFWFDDGSIVVQVQNHLFKVHKTLLARHSNFFAQLGATPKLSNDALREDLAEDCHYIVVDLKKRVLAQDVEVLLEHLYHDV
jgi:BTB/POZ domain